jgi:hypothetical protein
MDISYLIPSLYFRPRGIGAAVLECLISTEVCVVQNCASLLSVSGILHLLMFMVSLGSEQLKIYRTEWYQVFSELNEPFYLFRE